VAGPVSRVSGSGSDFLSGVFSGPRLAAENRALREQALASALYADQVARLEREVDALRALQGMPAPAGRNLVRAEVVGFFANESRITLNKGEQDGIRPGMPVVAQGGLLATVQTVEPKRAQAQLLTSAGITIGAIVLNRNPPPAGFLRGRDPSTLVVTFQEPKAPVEIGDPVATSGFSDKIPRGIPIGRVIQVEENEEFGTRRALIDPYVSIGSVREVAILR
jgi:rod shape-determining protein MreC